MRKFLALVSIMTATAFVSPMAMAKGASAPKAHASHAAAPHAGQALGKTPGKVAGKAAGTKAKRATPPRGPNGRFLPRQKAK